MKVNKKKLTGFVYPYVYYTDTADTNTTTGSFWYPAYDYELVDPYRIEYGKTSKPLNLKKVVNFCGECGTKTRQDNQEYCEKCGKEVRR
jgi:NADH pyrophosphatase NudC (nudix superfamily)